MNRRHGVPADAGPVGPRVGGPHVEASSGSGSGRGRVRLSGRGAGLGHRDRPALVVPAQLAAWLVVHAETAHRAGLFVVGAVGLYALLQVVR